MTLLALKYPLIAESNAKRFTLMLWDIEMNVKSLEINNLNSNQLVMENNCSI